MEALLVLVTRSVSILGKLVEAWASPTGHSRGRLPQEAVVGSVANVRLDFGDFFVVILLLSLHRDLLPERLNLVELGDGVRVQTVHALEG